MSEMDGILTAMENKSFGVMERKLNEKLTTVFQPIYLEIENESNAHNVPKGSETHFRVVIVSPQFVGQSRLERGRRIHQCLDQELKSGVHALSLKTLTPEEWQNLRGKAMTPSPECMGGSKKA